MSETKTRTENLLKTAFRPKQGITERLLCMRLIQATMSNDVGSIVSNTCMAASMVKQLQPNLEGFDFRKFRVMKMMYTDISAMELRHLPIKIQMDYYEKDGYLPIYPVLWSIPKTEEIYEKYLKPWIPSLNHTLEGIKKHRAWMSKIIHSESTWYNRDGCRKTIEVVSSEEENAKKKEWIGKPCPECGREIEKGVIISKEEWCVIPDPYWSYIFEVTGCLTLDGAKMFRSAFFEWCRDECGKAIMVMGSLVSQNIYDEVLKQLKTKPEEEN